MFPVLLRRIMLTVASLVFLALEGGFSVDVSGQHGRALITRSVPHREADYHRKGRVALDLSNLARIGGVLSQADSLIDLSGNPVPVRVELAADQPYLGHIDVYRTGSAMRYEYPIEYNDLVPMVLFVDSGGTSLYTLWESDRLPEDFEHDAGFVDHRREGLIALEFQGTRYSDAVYHLDTCRLTCVEPADKDLDSVVERINTELDGRPVDSDVRYRSYINTDVDLPVQVSVKGNLFFVNGNVARLYWKVSSRDRVVIHGAQRIVTPEGFSSLLKKYASQSLVHEIKKYVKLGLNIREAHFLFETLALLRSAKESSPDEWKNFRQALVSEVLVRANPEPWYRYSHSFCALYSDEDDCQN